VAGARDTALQGDQQELAAIATARLSRLSVQTRLGPQQGSGDTKSGSSRTRAPGEDEVNVVFFAARAARERRSLSDQHQRPVFGRRLGGADLAPDELYAGSGAALDRQPSAVTCCERVACSSESGRHQANRHGRMLCGLLAGPRPTMRVLFGTTRTCCRVRSRAFVANNRSGLCSLEDACWNPRPLRHRNCLGLKRDRQQADS